MQKSFLLTMLSVFFVTGSMLSNQSSASQDDNGSECSQKHHSSNSNHRENGKDGSEGAHSEGGDNDGSNDDHCNNKSKRSGHSGKLSARLNGTVQSGAYGRVKLANKKAKTELESEVKIPVPSPALLIASPDAAAAAIVTATLSRNGAEYAKCTFTSKSVGHRTFSSEHRNSNTAEYKLKAKSKNGSTRFERGSCADGSGTPIVPDLNAGDVIEVFIDSYTTGPFLTGTVQ